MNLNDKKKLLNLKKAMILYSEILVISTSSINKVESKTYTHNLEYIVGEPINYKINILYNYYECNCPKELQNYIFEKCDEYDVPNNIVMTIIEQESGGSWKTNGVISSTDDYGLAQINICNLSLIKDVFGYTKEEILYDPYKNIDAAIYLIKNIINMNCDGDKINIENVFGMYNGWTNWQNIEDSIKYKDSCMNILETKYSKKDDKNKVYVKREK